MRRILNVLIVALLLSIGLRASLTSAWSPSLALAALTGQSATGDLLQDIAGYRALLNHGEAYLPIGVEAAHMGTAWDTAQVSTHPPTAFLFTFWLTPLSWSAAQQAWALLMLALLALSWHLLGFSWRKATLLTAASLFWIPMAGALSQLTILWLFLLVLAYRLRAHPFWCGVLIGLASLPKFFPALVLLVPLSERKWKAAAGFGLVWGIALAWLLLLNPAVFGQYLSANLSGSPLTMARVDNAALLPLLSRLLGAPGLLLGCTLLGSIFYFGRSERWLTAVYASVALLPIAWPYSLMPLIFVWAELRKDAPLLVLLAILSPPALSIVVTGALIAYRNLTFSRFIRMPKQKREYNKAIGRTKGYGF